MIRYKRDRMLDCAASVKPTNACPDRAEGPCITERPNQIKKEEPKAGTSGLPDRKSSPLNRRIIEQKHWTGNSNSRIPMLRGFGLGELAFVHCPWCDRMHVHGWDPADGAQVKEWRVAHHTHNPSFPDSYQISVFRKKDLKWVGYGPLKGGTRYGK
jgi:hypothetical protein